MYAYCRLTIVIPVLYNVCVYRAIESTGGYRFKLYGNGQTFLTKS